MTAALVIGTCNLKLGQLANNLLAKSSTKTTVCIDALTVLFHDLCKTMDSLKVQVQLLTVNEEQALNQ